MMGRMLLEAGKGDRLQGIFLVLAMRLDLSKHCPLSA